MTCQFEDYYEKAVELSTFKSLRIAGEDFPYYFYIRWCNNEEELYNTVVSQRQRQRPCNAAFRS